MPEIIGFLSAKKEYGYMSNWYWSEFVVDGIRYTSSEQYMMHQKALLFGDAEVAQKILKTDDFAEIKALGRAVKNYNDTVWNGLRQPIVARGLMAKFAQNEDIREKLLATGDAVLAECADYDRVWGIGLAPDDERRLDMAKWQGQNLLGFTLMWVRQRLRNGE